MYSNLVFLNLCIRTLYVLPFNITACVWCKEVFWPIGHCSWRYLLKYPLHLFSIVAGTLPTKTAVITGSFSSRLVGGIPDQALRPGVILPASCWTVWRVETVVLVGTDSSLVFLNLCIRTLYVLPFNIPACVWCKEVLWPIVAMQLEIFLSIPCIRFLLWLVLCPQDSSW